MFELSEEGLDPLAYGLPSIWKFVEGERLPKDPYMATGFGVKYDSPS